MRVAFFFDLFENRAFFKIAMGVKITVSVPNHIADKLNRWLPVVLELNNLELTTLSAALANDWVRFFLQNPSPQAVVDKAPPGKMKKRISRLLARNKAGLLSEQEERELDELEAIEYLIRMAKIKAVSEL